MMSEERSLREKKLRGSGGHVFAKVTDDEQKKGNLGGPELFLAGIGRLPEERFSKYFCNKCEKEYKGSPTLKFENPNEDLGEGVTLTEKGEYKCASCENTIAQYRKFDSSSVGQQTPVSKNNGTAKSSSGDEEILLEQQSLQGDEASESPLAKDFQTHNSSYSDREPVDASRKTVSQKSQEDATFQPVQTLIGMPAYDSEARLIGKVQEIGLRRSTMGSGSREISVKITLVGSSNNNKIDKHTTEKDLSDTSVEILWDEISKIGDIVLLSNELRNSRSRDSSAAPVTGKCSSCGHQNEKDAAFCEECGNKLS
jgi:sporulation protein YlmC with PRC-barrel domain/DNA-directed RNA polymerase subunit RPC12/RpoP